MAKPYSQKLKLLYIMEILVKETDEEHPISIAKIIEKLDVAGITAERKSIYDDIEALRCFGLDIVNKREKPSGFYTGVREFELAELKLLVDAVQSSKFITAKKSNELIRKIENLTSIHEAKYLQRQVFVNNRIKTMNESIYYNVDKVHMAITRNVKIRFQYYEWTPKKEMRIRQGGKEYHISPWGLSWDDENYYMIGYDSVVEMVKHYRVDKMLHMKLSDEARDGEKYFEKFDIADYAKKVFGMYGGQENNIKILCQNSLAGTMIDRFGKDVKMRPVDDGHFAVNVMVNVSPQFFGWIMALGERAVIIAPEKVVVEFKEHVKRVMANY